jgi:hypothetical protein
MQLLEYKTSPSPNCHIGLISNVGYKKEMPVRAVATLSSFGAVRHKLKKEKKQSFSFISSLPLIQVGRFTVCLGVKVKSPSAILTALKQNSKKARGALPPFIHFAVKREERE